MICEYAAGGEIYDLIFKKGKLGETEARSYFFQILSAVEYAHNHGVAHRDLKLDNILLDEHKNIKVADFGLSTAIKDGEFLTTACGAHNYVAPEVISGQKYAGPEADIWSLGILLYAMLCGTLPFDEVSIPVLISKVKSGQYDLPLHLSTDARDLISKMIIVNPLYRISMSNIFSHSWISKTFHIFPMSLPKDPVIDEDVFQQVLLIPQFSNGIDTKEQKQKILSNKNNELFTVCYNMMLHTKLKNLNLSVCAFKTVFKVPKTRIKGGSTPCEWKYCLYFDSSPDSVMNKFCKILYQVNAKWMFFTPFHIKVIKVIGRNPGLKLKFQAYLYLVWNI